MKEGEEETKIGEVEKPVKEKIRKGRSKWRREMWRAKRSGGRRREDKKRWRGEAVEGNYKEGEAMRRGGVCGGPGGVEEGAVEATRGGVAGAFVGSERRALQCPSWPFRRPRGTRGAAATRQKESCASMLNPDSLPEPTPLVYMSLAFEFPNYSLLRLLPNANFRLQDLLNDLPTDWSAY